MAFSGGGDSLALLLTAKTWAASCGRPLLALHVDHGLQAQSGAWAAQAQAMAVRLDIPFRLLRWEGPKPQSGLPAAARAARHALLAEAARAAGARVLLVGHTLDDQLENAVMRGAGAPVGPLRAWSPSPVWPQGRGLYLCRPLLAARRAQLRAWLTEQGLEWIDDPANADPRYARSRARLALDGAAPLAPAADIRALAAACRATAWGGFEIDLRFGGRGPGPSGAGPRPDPAIAGGRGLRRHPGRGPAGSRRRHPGLPRGGRGRARRFAALAAGARPARRLGRAFRDRHARARLDGEGPERLRQPAGRGGPRPIARHSRPRAPVHARFEPLGRPVAGGSPCLRRSGRSHRRHGRPLAAARRGTFRGRRGPSRC